MARQKTSMGDGVPPAVSRRAGGGRSSRARHLWPWFALGIAILLVAVSLVLLGLSGRSLPVPEFVVNRIEARANAALAGQASVRIAGADVVVGRDFVPSARLRNVTLISPSGVQLARIADLRSALVAGALLEGRIQPSRLKVAGVSLALRRLPDGSLDVAPAAKGFSGAAQRPADIIAAVERAFTLPVLSGIETIDVAGLSLLFDDARSGQIWTVRDGTLTLHQDAREIGIDIGFGLSGGPTVQVTAAQAIAVTGQKARAAPPMASARLSLVVDKDSDAATLEARLLQVSARDLAAQVPALAWLAALDAPISGDFRSGIGAGGALGPLVANLDLGAGALRPTKDTRPIAFDAAHLGLSYDPATAALTLSDLRVDSPSLRAAATGQAWLKGIGDGVPDTLVGQVQLHELRADPAGLFAGAVTFGQGAMDLKLELDPFRLTIGQLVLVDRGRKISAKGMVAAEPEGWSVALDVAIDAIETKRLLALWPVSAVPRTRDWLPANAATGELSEVKAALRLRPGADPRLALGYQFREAEVRFMRSLPPIIGGSGYATIEDYAYTMVVDKGRVRAPKGGDLDVAGSVFRVPDIRVIPAPAEISLKSKSSITAALSILDEAPFHFLRKAGKPVDLAEGRAEVAAELQLKLVKALKPGDVRYQVSGRLTDVSSTRIVRDRVLSAAALSVTVDPGGLEITGAAALDGVPVTGTWRQDFGPAAKGKSRVTGQMDLSQATLDAFAIALPEGAVTGRGSAQVTVDLARDKPAAFRLESDLAGLVLSIPEVTWVKPADQTGRLIVAGRFGTPAEIDLVELDAAGLQAKGDVVLKPDGALDRAAFAGVRLDDWFTGDVTLTGQGKGKTVALSVANGDVDLRRATFGASSAEGEEAPPMTIALNHLQISEEISLDDFTGTFRASGGLSGDFSGMVNAAGPVTGSVVPAASGRAAFRIEAEDAGLALAAAGLYRSGRGGRMKLILQPEGDHGSYQGSMNIRGIRVVDAPELAGLLNAISVVGLINQLQGAGILFSDVSGQFLLTPDAVEIRQGSAVGASLGVSAAGLYRTADKSLDLQGVISPVYLLNGVGQIFSRQRDGLFGFNYTLTGTSDATEVSVNPLSILTPGMFRDLFRKDPPKIAP